MNKKKKNSTMSNSMAITLAAAVGTANAVALDDVALGFGIAILIFGTVVGVNTFRHHMNF